MNQNPVVDVLMRMYGGENMHYWTGFGTFQTYSMEEVPFTTQLYNLA